MECKITSEPVLVNEVIFEGSIEQPVDVDFTLPDYCPDIGKILKCRAIPCVSTRDVKNDTVTIEGMTKLEVIYIDGRDKFVRCCMHELPFTAKLPVGEVPEGTKAAADVRVDYVNCRATSQRRLDIHGAFTVYVRLTCPKQSKIASSADGAGVKVRKQIFDVSVPVGRAQNTFSISEALELPNGKPSIATVIRSGANITIQECKPIANKLITKGVAELTVVYCSDDGRIESMSYSLPFNQFFDVGGADDECLCDVSVNVVSVDLGLRTDSDGEYRRISADIRAFADVTAYRSSVMGVISDAYSTECELNLEKKHLDIERFIPSSPCRANQSGTLEFSRPVAEVLDTWCEVGICTSECNSGKVRIGGSTMLCAIIRTEEGDCEYSESSCPFECEMPVESDCSDIRCAASVQPTSCNYSLTGSGRIELRTELAVKTSVCERNHVACITAIKPDENRRKSPEARPAVVMYFAGAGEELWDIARAHDASVEAIRQDNELIGERLEEDKLLLISVG